jgi:hypothetical protein
VVAEGVIVGGAKEQQIEDDDRGYGSLGGFVGPECVEEPFIQAFITAAAEQRRCDFCGRKGKSPFAASAEAAIAFFMEGVATEYARGVDVPYDDEDGTYLAQTFLARELPDKLGIDFGPSFLAALKGALGDETWCEIDPMAPRPHEQDLASWERFSDLVTHRVRYVVHEYEPDDDWLARADAPTPPKKMLSHIARTVEAVPGMIRTLPAETKVFRCRWSRDGTAYSTAKELGAPPAHKALANRMSPEGISVFSGAFDQDTALVEALRGKVTAGSLGVFTLLRPVLILDLTKAPTEVPSLWDAEGRWMRTPIRFLQAFQSAVSQKIDREAASYEYTPTQYLAEFFRWIYRHPSDGHIGGISYPSAQVTGGRNIVFFVDSSGCCDDAEPGCVLRLTKSEVGIDPTSVATA